MLLDFWATWCAPCRVAIPELRDLTHRYSPEQFSIVSVSVDDDEELVRRFATKNDMTWTLCHDTERAVQRLFRVNVFPTYLVIDAEGVIRQEIHGTNPRQSVGYRLRATLDALPELSAATHH